MFKLNYAYSTKELAQELGISYQTLRLKRNEQIENLKCFCEVTESKKGPGLYYTITVQWEEYTPLSKSKKNLEYIRARLKSDILVRPDGSLQTAANIGEIVADDLKIKPASAARYASMALKQFYGIEPGDCGPDGHVGDKKVWAYHLGQYWQRLPEEVIQELVDEYSKQKEINGIGDSAELSALEDLEEQGNKLNADQLLNARMRIWNKIKKYKCEEMNWRWIMKVKEYLVHEVEED